MAKHEKHEKHDAPPQSGVTGTGSLGGGNVEDGPGTNAAVQHRAFEDIARAAQQEDLAKRRGPSDTGIPPEDYARRHDIPPDTHPSRAHEGDEAEPREDSDEARRKLIAEKGVGVDLNDTGEKKK